MDEVSSGIEWWATQKLNPGSVGRWVVGPSSLWIQRLESEWRILHEQVPDPFQDEGIINVPLPETEHHPFADQGVKGVRRFATSDIGSEVTVYPALADRAVVVRPDLPFNILPHQKVNLFVSTPLWLQVRIGSPGKMITEFPSFRLPDSWLGPPTEEGELCYAIKTAGRLDLTELPLRPHRAITPIVVHNLSGETLMLERVKLQVQHLSLYVGSSGFLWTQSAILEGDEPGALAKAHFEQDPPTVVRDARLLTGPRSPARPTIVKRFTTLFGR
jgi:hypothetical protein